MPSVSWAAICTGGAQSYLPLKVDQSGVIAVIFAVSLLAVPLTVVQFFPNADWAQKIMHFWTRGNWIYQIFYATLIIFFCYFYNSVSISPRELADNMQKSGGFIPGYRPGDSTARYIEWVLDRITLGGAFFVAAIAVLPDILRRQFNVPFYFGGTALLIAVGVALDTIGQLEALLIMRHYEGFLRRRGGEPPTSAGRPVRPKYPPPELQGGQEKEFPKDPQ